MEGEGKKTEVEMGERKGGGSKGGRREGEKEGGKKGGRIDGGRLANVEEEMVRSSQ